MGDDSFIERVAKLLSLTFYWQRFACTMPFLSFLAHEQADAYFDVHCLQLSVQYSALLLKV